VNKSCCGILKESSIVGIGFCGENVSLYRTFPGWAKFSWGYHGDDGKVYDNGTGKDYGPNFGKGDTVGCGVNWQDEAFFFTLNGKFLGERCNLGLTNE